MYRYFLPDVSGRLADLLVMYPTSFLSISVFDLLERGDMVENKKLWLKKKRIPVFVTCHKP